MPLPPTHQNLCQFCCSCRDVVKAESELAPDEVDALVGDDSLNKVVYNIVSGAAEIEMQGNPAAGGTWRVC